MKPYKAPYKDHGSRHHPVTGSDPIPGLGATSSSWALIVDDNDHTVDHSGGANSINLSGGTLYTNDTSTFELTAISTWSITSLKILTAGTYKLTAQGMWSTIESTATGVMQYQGNSEGIGAASFSFVFGRGALQGNETWWPAVENPAGPSIFWQILINAPDDTAGIDGGTGNNCLPLDFRLLALQDSATLNAVVTNVGILVERIDTKFYSPRIFGCVGP